MFSLFDLESKGHINKNDLRTMVYIKLLVF